MLSISRFAFATFAALSAIGLGEADATPIPSVIGAATIANLTFGPNLVSDAIRVVNPDSSIIAFGKTAAQETNCASGGENAQATGEHQLNGCLFALNPSQVNASPADLSRINNLTLIYWPDGTLSDIFGITCVAEDASQNCTTGALAFLTQINGQPIDLTPLGDTSSFFKLTKIAGGPGTVFDMTYYLAPSWRDAGATARFISANQVPEPDTLSLYGAGLAGVFAMRRRKKKSA